MALDIDLKVHRYDVDTFDVAVHLSDDISRPIPCLITKHRHRVCELKRERKKGNLIFSDDRSLRGRQ